jgi:hypothetical protein
MFSQPCDPTSTQRLSVSEQSTQDVVVQKIPFHKPQIGPLRHILQETGEKGKSKEYDSYSDNRP